MCVDDDMRNPTGYPSGLGLGLTRVRITCMCVDGDMRNPTGYPPPPPTHPPTWPTAHTAHSQHCVCVCDLFLFVLGLTRSLLSEGGGSSCGRLWCCSCRDDTLTPTAYPPHTAADTAHSPHSTQPALRPHRATPRAEEKNPQTRRPHSNGLGRLGPNLKPGTVCVCCMKGLRKGMNTTQHPPSPAFRAWTDPPTNEQAVSRAVRYVNTHRPRVQIKTRPSYVCLVYFQPSSSSTPRWYARAAQSTHY